MDRSLYDVCSRVYNLISYYIYSELTALTGPLSWYLLVCVR